MTETPEIPEVALKAAEAAMRGHDCNEVVNANIPHLARAALAAALPHLHPEPTFTASEVKELTTKATEVALALGRKEAGEEIAAAITKAGEERSAQRHSRFEDVSDHGSTRYAAYLDAATIARNIGSQPHQAASNGLTAPTGHSDLPPTPEAAKARKETPND